MSEIRTHYEYWRHKSTGRVWAVELLDGRVGGVAGPLDRRDATIDLLPHLLYTFPDVHWVEQERKHLTHEVFEWNNPLTSGGSLEVVQERAAA